MADQPLDPNAFLIETERLILRKLDVDDAAFMLELLNDEAFLRNIGDRGVRTIADASTYILNGSVASCAKHGFGFWCVVLKETGTRIGICGLTRRDILGDVDIGFAFLPEHRSLGYALESARVVMTLARETFGLSRIVAITAPTNTPSALLLEKLGLRFERMIKMAEDAEEIRLFAWNA